MHPDLAVYNSIYAVPAYCLSTRPEHVRIRLAWALYGRPRGPSLTFSSEILVLLER